MKLPILPLFAIVLTFSLSSFGEFGFPPGGGPGPGFGGGGFAGGPGGLGGPPGGGQLTGEDMASIACEADWANEEKRLRAELAPAPSSGFGGTQRVFEGAGESGNETSSLTGTGGTTATGSGTGTGSGSGGQVVDLSALGMDDLLGSLEGGQGFHGGRNFNGQGTPTATSGGNPQPVNFQAILAGFDQAGNQVGRQNAELEAQIQAKKWPFIANCIREVRLAAGLNPDPQSHSNGGGLNPMLLQLLLSDDENGGGEEEVNFYTDLPGENAPPQE